MNSWDRAADTFQTHDAPAYARLARAFADEPEAGVPESPLVVLAALRLAAFEGRATDPFVGDVEATRADALRLADEISEAVATGLVQYTDPLRLGDIVPGLCLTSQWYPGRPLRIVDLGTSAGMLLLASDISIRFSNASWTPQGSLEAVDYPMAVPRDLLATPVPIESAVGIDLRPLDVRDPRTPRLLHSYQWPGPAQREERLDLGIRVASQRPPHLIAGDVLEVAPDVIRECLSREAVTVVIDSAFSHYLPVHAQVQLGRILDMLRGLGPLVMLGRGPQTTATRARSTIRAIDMTGQRRMVYAETDLLSESPAWIACP